MPATIDNRIRITARVPKELRSTLEEAAQLQGATLNQFLVQAGWKKNGRRLREGAGVESERTPMTAKPSPIPFMTKAALALFFVNLIAIIASAVNGAMRGNIALRFEEQQAITILSSNQLACTSLLGWLTFMLKKRPDDGGRVLRQIRMEYFWLLSAFGFLYLMLDESFRFHEGMDTGVLRLFGYTENPMLDGLATGLYGIVAAGVCYAFRSELLKYRDTVLFFGIGGVFLVATSALNLGDAPKYQIAIEESCKLLGVVSFLLGHLAAYRHAVNSVSRSPSDDGWGGKRRHTTGSNSRLLERERPRLRW